MWLIHDIIISKEKHSYFSDIPCNDGLILLDAHKIHTKSTQWFTVTVSYNEALHAGTLSMARDEAATLCKFIQARIIQCLSAY